MAEFNLDTLKKGFSKKVTEVNVKTSAFLEINKIKTYITTINQEIERLQKEVGEQVYMMWTQGEVNILQLEGFLIQMQEKHSLVEEQQQKIQEIEEANRKLLGEAGAAHMFCSYCGAANATAALFCRECGKKLD